MKWRIIQILHRTRVIEKTVAVTEFFNGIGTATEPLVNYYFLIGLDRSCNRLYIVFAKASRYYSFATQFFAALLCCSCLGACSKKGIQDGTTPAYNVPSKAPVEGSRITWDSRSLKRLSTASFGFSGYARMAMLKDGSWLCVMEENGAIVSLRSNDDGRSWTGKKTIIATSDVYSMANPELLVLKDGVVLMFYNPRPKTETPSLKFEIRVTRSEDNAVSFKTDQLLYQGGYQFANGCWEPAAIQLPSGEIQVFFANEAPYTSSDEQNISVLRSANNGISWTTQPEIIAFRKGSRDGMPVPLLNRDQNKIWVAIEDPGNGSFKPYLISNSIGDNWQQVVDGNSKHRYHALADSLAPPITAAAPYLRQISTGELVLSYQSAEERGNQMSSANMKVVLGTEKGNDFNRKTVPFQIAANSSALWNSLFVPNDSTVVAITSTNGYTSGVTEVWMIKGRIVPELEVGANTAASLPVFVGQQANGRLAAGFNSTNDSLKLLVQTEKPAFGNMGVALYVNNTGRHGVAPEKGQFRFHISAQSQVSVWEGNSVGWKPTDVTGATLRTVMVGEAKHFELSIAWSMLGGKPPAGKRFGYHMAITTGDNNFNLVENLSSNLPDQPYTWSGMRLK